MYIFTYGSLMNKTQVEFMQVAYTERLKGTLHDYRFCLNKKKQNGYAAANIMNDEGNYVEGILYLLTEDKDIDKIRLREGVDIEHYREILLPIELADGNQVEAYVYVANPWHREEGLYVEQEYLEHILIGADLLSDDYVRRLETFKDRVHPVGIEGNYTSKERL